jgi:hypothetical protein
MYSNHKAPRKVSRRAVLGTAGVGAVGAAAVGVGIMAFNREPESNNTGQTVENAGTTAAAPEDMVEGSPVVLYLDGRNGPMRIFAGTDEWTIDDRELADRVWRASQQK